MLALQHALGCSCRITAPALAASTPDAPAATRLLPNASPQAAAAAKPSRRATRLLPNASPQAAAAANTRTRAQASNVAHK